MKVAHERRLPPAPPDDATLVLRFLAGDELAFDDIFHRYARHIAGVAYRLMGDDTEIDDVVQETFVDAAKGMRGLREPEKLRAWLVAIAARCAKRHLRRRGLRRWLGLELLRSAQRTSDPAVLAPVDALHEALRRLSPRLRIPWVLHHVEGCSLPEAAEACGVSLATVKRRIAEADLRIRRTSSAH